MIVKEQFLSQSLFNKSQDKISTRQGYGEGVKEAGEKDPRVVVLCADLTESTKSDIFKKSFPERFIEMGVAEQALATVAAGMANYGKIPFISSYAIFSPGRNWEQIRTTIAVNDVPVKIIGAHTGVSVGPDGATHQALEDIALMRVMPNMIVIAPCDAIEARKATLAVATNGKPSYIRLTREATPVITTEETSFKVGKAEVLWESKDPKVAIIAAGPVLYEALKAAEELSKVKINSLVINSHTIKPLDEQAIVQAAKIAGAVVTVEEHQQAGGLGGAVSEVLAKKYPVPMEFIGIADSFGESGKPDELLEKFNLKSKDIVLAAKRAIKRRLTSELT